MHRSGSTTRSSDDYFVVGLTAAAAATPPSAGGQVRRSSSMGLLPRPDELLLLPKYDPQSSLAKKEAARSRSAEAAVHVIPLVLVACALVLWFFSSNPKLDVVSKDDSLVARIENMTIDGYSNDAHSLLADDVSSAELRTEEEVHGRMLMEKELEQGGLLLVM